MKKLRKILGITTLLVVLGASAAEGAPSGILTGDETSQACEHVDPIVSPGERSAHEHMFFGGGPVSRIETSADLRRKTTTMDVRSNFTAVWIPCVYEDGREVNQATRHGILIYYRSVRGTEIAFPENFGSVSHRYGYRCGIGGGSFSSLPPASCSSGDLVIFIDFNVRANATDWDPRFANLRVFIRLDIGPGPVGNITLGGPVLGVDGATGPRHMHGDYFAAHDTGWYQRFLEQCLRPGRRCGRNPAL